MKIAFIRHSKVLFKWRSSYNSSSFYLACNEYDISPVQVGKIISLDRQTVYMSNLIRTEATAKNLFQEDVEVIKTDLLNEIPLTPFIDTGMPLPTILWMVLGRLKWYLNSSKQQETREKSTERINNFLDLILHQGQDCIIFGHGFYFAQMTNQMKKRAITGDMRRRLKNEEVGVFFFRC